MNCEVFIVQSTSNIEHEAFLYKQLAEWNVKNIQDLKAMNQLRAKKRESLNDNKKILSI